MRYSYIFLYFLLLNCNSKKNDDFLIKTGEVNILSKDKISIEGHFVENNKDLFFSYSNATRNIHIYDGKKAIDSLSLHIKNLQANKIVVKNTDSIFIIDYTTKIIRHINIRGKIIKEIDVQKISNQDTINPYLFKNPEAINDQNIILDVGISKNKYTNLTHQQLIDSHKHIPRFIKYNGESIHYPDFNYTDIEKLTNKRKEDLFVDYSNVSLSKKYIVYTMQFSNHLYVFDYNLKLVKTVPIVSDFTGTDINKDFSFYNDSEERGRIYEKNYDYATLTKYIVYNKYKDKFYVLLAHKTDILKKENLIFKRSNRDFSILEYDGELNKLNEQKFKKGQYDIYKPIFINSEGNLLLNSNNELNSNFSPDKIRYDIYKISD